MADKPSYQQNLAKRLGDIWLDIHRINSEAGLLYVSTFWETICREWSGIDRLRLDKYYFLLRRFMLAGFECMREGRWEVDSICAYNKILVKYPLNPTRGDVPDALRIYFLENFANIFVHIEGEGLSVEASRELLRPYVELAGESLKKSILDAAEAMFKELAQQEMKNKLDVKAIGKLALSLGEVEECTLENRKLLYSANQLLGGS